VVRETHLQRRFRSCSAHCRPACWRSGCNRGRVTTGGLRPPLLFRRRCVCAAQKSLFRRRTNAIHKSGGREPAVASGTAPPTTISHTFGHGRRTRTKSGGREPAVCRGDALAKALPQLLGRLLPACWRTLLRSRCRNHGGLRLPLVSVAGEWESNRLSKRCFVNHGGLTPPALVRARSPTDGIATFAMHKRTCIGAAGVSPPCGCQSCGGHDYVHIRKRSSLAASGAAGVSPPCLWETHVQG